MYEIEELDPELKKYATYDYWNDEEKEKGKVWDIRDGNYSKLEMYLQESGLQSDLVHFLEISGLKKKKDLMGIDLAAGICWSALCVFNELDIKKMNFLEFSNHRLVKIAPILLEHYCVPNNKVQLLRGSFYDTKIRSESLDFVICSQALHHADNIKLLLIEIWRILKQNGMVFVIGEPYMDFKFLLLTHARLIRDFMLGRNSECIRLFRQYGCLALDKELGDRCYSLFSYKRIFRKMGFKVIAVEKRKHLGFILEKV